MNTNAPNPHSAQPKPAYVGHRVLDEQGTQVGTVTDVIFDDHDQPEYLVVDPGLLRAAHYVPAAGTYISDDENVVVPWEKHWITHGIKATRHHILSRDDREALEEHYAA